MRRSVLSLGLSSLAIATLAGCIGDDTVGPLPVPDSGSSSDASGMDATTGPGDAGTDAADAAPLPSDSGQDAAVDAALDASDASVGPFLLLSYYFDGYSDTQYSAFNVPAATVQGGLGYAQYGVNVSTNQAPWILEQANDLVLRMDPSAPWQPTYSWSLANVPQATTFGNTDPFAVAEVGTKAYVLGYATDYIAVLDTSQAYDAGAPTKVIALVPDPDASGDLEAIALAYDASQSRIWVILGNANSPAYPPICAPEYHPFVVAIDTTTDEIVSGVQYSLQGYGTPLATNAVVFDSANDRLLIATEGCDDPVDAGEAGVTAGTFDEAYIEQISLAPGADAGTDTILLALSPSNSPAALVYVDETHAFIQTGNGTTNAWNPTQPTLGPAVANPPDTFVWDGQGHLLGPQSTLLPNDGGVSIAVVAVDPMDGGVTTLATNPFTPLPANPFAQQTWQSVDLWPHP
jgi:hypothetical protein